MSLSLVRSENTESDLPAAPGFSEAEARRLSAEQEDTSPEAFLRWALSRWGRRLALVTSFQAEGMVLLDMALEIEPRLRVITLDTGRLPAEAYELMERVRERYGVEIEVFFPEAAAVEEMVRGAGPNLFYQSVEARLRCCRVRKVEPLGRALAGVDAWITGLRRDQTASRASIRKVEIDGQNPGKVKLSPLAGWSSEQVWDYIRERRVPYHSLYERGYTSIGCAPCTRPTAAGESPRAGRWWWERGGASECGLHWRQPAAEKVAEGTVHVPIDLLGRSVRSQAPAAGREA